MTLDELLHNPKALPTAPKVLADLIHSFEDPEVSVAQITRTVSADPVLSAKLLRLANSAYYKMSRSVATVDDAVRMLGFVTVRTLVISSGLVIIHAGMPAEAQKLDDYVGPYDPGRMQHEMSALGFSFYDVGAGLAQRWKFPAVFTRTIREVPAPLQATPPDRLAALIHLAAWRAQLNEAREAPDDIAGEAPTGVAALFGLEPGLLLEEMPPLAELSAGLEELIK